MDGYLAQQIRDAEAPLLAAGLPLMARAAHALAGVIHEVLVDADAPHGPILVVAGSGNNGGDALFAAAELAGNGVAVAIAPVGSSIHDAGLAAALAAGARLIANVGDSAASVVAAAEREASGTRLVVDGILGTGSAGHAALRGTGLAVVSALVRVRESQAEPFAVVAVDIPSGLDPDSGEKPGGVVLPATATVTFGACKAGLLRGDGPETAGIIHVIDIGLMPGLAGVSPVVARP